MPILQGMELQVILSDVARIMDLPFHDQQSFIQEEMQENQNNPQQQQQQPPQQQQQPTGQQILAILDEEAASNKAGQIWSNHLSPGSDCSNPEVITEDTSTDMFAWPNEFKLAFTTATITGVNNGKMVASNNAAISRKRKICNQVEEGASQVKMVPQQPQQQQQQQQAQQQQQQTPQQQLQLQLLEERMAKLREKSRKQDAGPRLGGWQVEDLEAELDASGLGLGVDLSTSTNSYNMSETLLALPSLTVFKQEAPSPSANNDGLPQQSPTPVVGEADSNSGVASQLHQLLQQHSSSAFTGNGVSTTAQAQRHQLDTSGSHPMVGSTTGSLSTVLSQNNSAVSSPVSSSSPSDGQQDNIDCRFQYVLAAATSIATKVNEETLTYLNQGQSYEIKLKKLGELSAYRGKILKSAIRICFHERRLQYMEREQMAAWQASRPGDRIVEVDVPLSYGLLDVVQDPQLLNTVEFLWDPTKEVGVYIKVNCISTEFTPKKHGGEKGVPFRIQVETFLQGESGLKRLHAAACQIKVFKLKGADRKHKQDREKILKRPPSEQEKFQPSYECTVLNDIPSDAIVVAQPVVPTVTSSVASTVAFSPSDSHVAQGRTSTTPTTGANLNPVSVAPKEESKPVVPSLVSLTPPAVNPVLPEHPALPSTQEVPLYLQPLASEASSQQTAQWLQTHRFGSYLRTFASFSGADLLRLSRDDLIQICGLADGIRLYNALHSKTIAPRLTMYLCVEQSSVYHALYLDSLSCAEMAGKLALLLGVVPDQVRDVYLQGPNGIHVLITDEVVRNFKDEAMFTIEILQDPSGEQYRLLLKPTPH